MRATLRPLFLLHSDAVLRERVHRASAGRFACLAVPGWDALLEALERAPASSVAVVDPYAECPGGKALSPRLRALLERFPSVAVLAALEPDARRAHDLRTLGEWGVAEVIPLDGRESTESISRRIRSVQGRELRNLLERSLPACTSGRGRAVLCAAAEVAPAGGQGRDLADALGVSERALNRWCERARLPRPRRILAWMRVLLAAELLDRPEETVLSVAHTCGYATESTLRRALQELTGATPSELRGRGAFAAASGTFLQELDRLRQECHSDPHT